MYAYQSPSGAPNPYQNPLTSGVSSVAYPSPLTNASRSRPSQASSRFVPQNFKYNGRVALALLPSLAVVANFGGSQVLAALVVGFMGAYILDGMRFKEGAFTAVWATLAATNLALTYNALFINEEYGILLSTLALILSSLALFLTGLWATLQFKWIQLQYPAVILAFEKMLILGCLPVAATVQAWGIATTSGMHSMPFLLAAILCILYALFALPLPSSFHLASTPIHSNNNSLNALRKTSSSPPSIQGIGDGVSSFLLTACLPAAVYAATHSHVLFQWVHLWSILLISAGPLLVISALPQGTWWLGRSAAADALRQIILLLSLGAFLAGTEGRIIFHSFGQYIRLSAPWSYIAITIGMYGVGALILLYWTGMIGDELAGIFLGPSLMIGSSVGALIVGMSVWAVPAPLLAAAGLAMFHDSRSLREYLFFSVGASVTGIYFLWQHFWFLDITLDGMHLRTLCMALGAAMIPAFLVPGIILSGSKGRLVELLLLLQAGLLAVVEERLYAGDHVDITYNIHPMFPSFLVMATTAAGVVMSKKLLEHEVIGDVTSYALQCLYGAKIAMLVVPEARLTVPVLALALAASPPMLLQTSEGPSGSHRHRRLAPWQGLALATAVVLSVVAARFAIFDMLHLVFNRRPSEALAGGALLITAGVGCLPLVSRYYKGSTQIKRVLLLVVSTGIILALLRPPMPIRGGAKCPHLPFGLCPRLWNEEHAPEHEEDDVAVYGDGLRRREHWPLWLLVGAAVAGMIAATSPVAVRDAAPLRLMQAAVSAALVGGYMALDFFPEMTMLQLVIVGSALSTASAVVFLQLPTRGGAVLLPLACLAWLGSLPLALMFHAASTLPPVPYDMERVYPDNIDRAAAEDDRKLGVKYAVLACYAAEALLLAFAMKLRVASAGRSTRLPGTTAGRASTGPVYGGGDLNYIDKAASFLGQCIPTSALQATSMPLPPSMMMHGSSANNLAYQKLASERMPWVPTACNVVVLLCGWLCWVLNGAFTDGNAIAAMLLAPVTLLFCQDPLLFWGLNDSRRYFPPAFAAAGMLFASAGGLLFKEMLNIGYSEYVFAYDGWYLLKNTALLVLCLPTQLDFLSYLWLKNRVGLVRAVIPALIGSIGIVFSGMEGIQYLSGLNLVEALILAATTQHRKQIGRRII